MSSATNHSNLFPLDIQKPNRRKFIQALAIGITTVTGFTVFGEPVLGGPSVQVSQEPTTDLYQACIDASVQSMNLGLAAMKLRDGKGTIEEARVELAALKAAVEAIVI